MHIQLHNPKDVTTGISCNPISNEKQITIFSIVIQRTDVSAASGICIYPTLFGYFQDFVLKQMYSFVQSARNSGTILSFETYMLIMAQGSFVQKGNTGYVAFWVIILVAC